MDARNVLESLDTNQVKADQLRLYTVAQFRNRVAAYQRAEWIGLTVIVAGMIGIFAALGAFVVVGQYIAPEPEWTPPPLLVGIGVSLLVLSLLTPILIIIGVAARLESIKRRDPVACERCGKTLDVPSDLSFAIAIHCCPYCQCAMFQEWTTSPALMALPDAADSDKSEFTFADISEGDRKRFQAERKWFVFVMAIATPVAALVLGITAVAASIGYDPLMVRFGDLAPEVAKLIVPIPAAIVLGIGFFWAMCRTPGAFPKCGGCGSRIVVGDYIRATGNCWMCGRRVIRDAPVLRFDDDPAEGQRIERADFTAGINRYTKISVWCIAGVFVVGGIAWPLLFSWWLGIPMHGQLKLNEFVAFFFSFFVFIFLLLAFGWIQHRVLPRPRCPHCQQPLESRRGMVQATGNCFHCGRRVLASSHAVGRQPKD